MNTLFQETKKHHNQKGWIRGNTKIGPVLEVATRYLHGKYGVEIRNMSFNEDNSHSWVRVSHGSNKLVTNLKSSDQETSEVQLKEHALKLDASDFACRSKAKAFIKTRTCRLFHQEPHLLGKELGPMLNHHSPITRCRRN